MQTVYKRKELKAFICNVQKKNTAHPCGISLEYMGSASSPVGN